LKKYIDVNITIFRRLTSTGDPVPHRSAAESHRTAALGAIRTLVAAFTRSARSIEWRTGLTNAQLFLMLQLAEGESLSVNELAERARTTQGTVSAVLRRMIDGGLVQRDRARDDARRAALSLTAKGRRLIRHAPTPPTEALLQALGGLSDAESFHLSRGLKALLRELDLPPAGTTMLFEAAPPRGRRS
jgi:DNA-binding MarR family transcriptional regulator